MNDYRSALADRNDPGMVIGGEVVYSDRTHRVLNSFRGEHVGTISLGDAQTVSAAVSAAHHAVTSGLPAHARYDLLMKVAAAIEADADSYALDLAREGHKSIREARSEPFRAANVLKLSAEEGRRITGETLPFDTRPGSEKRVGYYFRVPVGVVAAILPFNDPLTVASHKVGPAIAAGNACVIKPDSRSAMAVLRLAHEFKRAGAPPGLVNCVTGGGEDVGSPLVRDPRVRMISFTGGHRTGEKIAAAAGIRRVSLELGSNSAVIVLPDANLDDAVAATCAGAFAQAGQNCLGVQRILVHEAVYERFTDGFLEAVGRLKTGSSLSELTDVCPLITEDEALRVEALIEEAVRNGARVLVGGSRTGAVVEPAVIVDLPASAALATVEAYGPVVSLHRIASLDAAIELANSVPYGLQAAIFTEGIGPAFEAARRLEVGGVIVNDSTDYRLDAMPFGGTKSSGLGREGVRFAIQEMTETRVVCFNLR